MITSETAKAGPFTGDGETLVFDFSFTALDADHVAVYVDGVKVTTGFTVELLTGGGRVTFAEAPEDGALVSIIRDVPAKQEMDLQNNTAFLPEVIETAFDRLTMMIQQLRDLFSRTPVAPPTEDMTSEELYSQFTGALDTVEEAAATVTATVSDHNSNSSAHSAIQTKIGTDISTHNTSGSAHSAIQTKIGTDIGTHNSNSSAHTAIQTKIGTDIGVHNSAVDAHADIRMALGDGVAAGISTHNSNASAHTAIQTKIGTDIGTHNSAVDAHAGFKLHRVWESDYVEADSYGRIKAYCELASYYPFFIGEPFAVVLSTSGIFKVGTQYKLYGQYGSLLVDRLFYDPADAQLYFPAGLLIQSPATILPVAIPVGLSYQIRFRVYY